MAKKPKSEAEETKEEVITNEEEIVETPELIEAPKPTMRPEEIESRYQAFLEKIKHGGK